jgi:hypothetical protein
MSRWSMLRDAHGEITCHVNHPFIGSPISIYPCARLRTAGDICPHATATNDNPAGAPRTDAEVEECLACLLYRRPGRWERDREKPECLLGIRTITIRQGKTGQKRNAFRRKGTGGPRIRLYLSTDMRGRTSRSAGSSSGTQLS